MEIKNNTDIEKTNMENYKVILVDDEEEVIDAIKSRILWEQLGLQIVGSATNGVKALELVEKLQPDIVITDIKMPYMNGLELSRRLNDEYRNVHIIIFTGFDEFDYAKEAVHLEIDEYMLKPINAVELSECLKRVKNSLDKEREEKLNVQKLENYFDDVLPIIQTNFFVSLIEGRVNESEYEKFLQAYKIDLNGPYFCCAVFHTSENNVPEEMSPLLLSMSVEREIKARIVGKFKCREFIYLGNTVLIIELKSKEETVELTDVCDKFCKWVNRVIGAVVTAGIGMVCDNISNINNSYDGAREAVSYRVLYGTKRAINIDEITPNKQNMGLQSEETKQLKSVRNSKSRRLINDAKNIVANRYMEEDLSLDKVCSIMGVSNSYFSSIFKKETGISFVSYLTDYRMDIAAKLILDTNEKSYKIGEMVGYMDANYFSYVFKKKFGISPSKYRNAKLKS